MNVSQAEIDKFSALAARWWDKSGEFKPLHELNPLRLDFIESHAPLAGKKVLDVGCGGGILSEAMAAAGAEVTAIDLSQATLSVAKLHLLESKIKVDYRLISTEDLALEAPHQFDLITCMEMLEHVPDPSSIIKACATLLKPNGDIFFSTINRNPKSFLQAIVGAEYLLNILPKGTHEYAKFIKPSELTAFARKSGFSIANSTGICYNPLKRQYRLDSKLDVNYLLHFQAN